MAELEQFYRRAIFNILGRNQDDHVKNIAFLMNRHGHWSLAPAFDLVFSYNPDGDWTARHQMTLNGHRDHFSFDDLRALARVAGLKRGQDRRIVEEVRQSVLNWSGYANQANLPNEITERIAQLLRAEDIQP